MTRALWLAAIAFLLAATAPAAHAFGFADVDRRARELANRPYTKSAVVLPKQLKDLRFDQTAFNYGKNKIDRSQLGKLGFAGFRIHFPLNVVPSAPGYKDELVSFL